MTGAALVYIDCYQARKSNDNRDCMQLSAGRGCKRCVLICLVCGVLQSDE